MLTVKISTSPIYKFTTCDNFLINLNDSSSSKSFVKNKLLNYYLRIGSHNPSCREERYQNISYNTKETKIRFIQCF